MNENPCSNHEIHVLFEHGFCFCFLYNEPRFVCLIYTESNAARTDHYVDVFGRENVARILTLRQRYDVRKFNADAILC